MAQAGFGGNYEEIQYVTQVGVNAWLEEQFSMSYDSYLDTYKDTYQEVIDSIHTLHPGAEVARSREYTDFVFWEKAFSPPPISISTTMATKNTAKTTATIGIGSINAMKLAMQTPSHTVKTTIPKT